MDTNVSNEDFILDENKKKTPLKISFLSKEVLDCPVCNESFHKEELLTGSGRLIAGPLTDELHRLYETSARYGDIYPLAYQAVVCPNCWFASSLDDFPNIPNDQKEQAFDDGFDRKDDVANIFSNIDFYKPRTLLAGTVSQYLVMRCYDYYSPEFSPTVKQGLAALRASWLIEHMDENEPGQHWDWLAVLFKRKARFFCSRALQNEASGKESLSALKIFGPDVDKNYGYEGFLYITEFLEFKYGDQSDMGVWREKLADTKRTLAKMFGLGKSSKSKPGPLLEKSRKLYDLIAKELQDFDE